MVTDYRQPRSLVGLVPQEVKLDIFARVLHDRALHARPVRQAARRGLARGAAAPLALWDKRDAQVRELSGGMMRRVLIAKALSHRPQVLFLDEPTAGVDVELRKGMWDIVRDLRAGGTTIILTTHYIEEAEAMADRIAVINGGRILLVEEKATLMRRMGQKRMTIELQCPVEAIPESLAAYSLTRNGDGRSLEYAYDTAAQRTGITSLLRDLSAAGLVLARRADPAGLARGHLRRPGEGGGMNWRGVWAIYRKRDGADLPHAAAEPHRAGDLDLALLRRLRHRDRLAHRGGRGRRVRRLHRARPDHADRADPEPLERLLRHLLPEVRRHDLRAPVGAGLLPRDRHRLRRRGGDQVAADRADHLSDRQLLRRPAGRCTRSAMLAFLALTCISFSLFGFIIGIWAKNFEQLQLVPMLIVSPLVFLGGSFYSISMLPPAWQTITLFNPVVYLVSGFRWSFFGTADVGGRRLEPLRDRRLHRRSASPSIWWIFRTGYRLRT